MTTTTDDITPRLVSVESAIRDVRDEQRETNARLSVLESRTDALTERTANMEGRLTALETSVSEMRADTREIHAQLVQMQQETNVRMDRMQQETASRIDKVFWAVVGAGVSVVVVGGGVIGALVAIAFRTT